MTQEFKSIDPVDRIVLSPHMNVEQIDEKLATIYLQETGARIRISRQLYELLLMFEKPVSTSSVIEKTESKERTAKAIEALFQKKFLVQEAELDKKIKKRTTLDAAIRMFNCPVQKVAPASADVVFLGVPYDLSDRAAAGTREGPTAFRTTSLQFMYAINRLTGKARGWYDTDQNRQVLQGVVFGDCGDVNFDYGESQSALFERTSRILDEVTSTGTLPVLLGGDASISFPAIRSLQDRGPVTVVRISGQIGRQAGMSSDFVTSASLPGKVLELPNVQHYIHIGVPDDSAANTDQPSGYRAVALSAFKTKDDNLLSSLCGENARLYVSIDASTLGTVDQKAEASCGLDYSDVVSVLHRLGAQAPFAGLDVTGINPTKPLWRVNSVTTLFVLMNALTAAKD